MYCLSLKRHNFASGILEATMGLLEKELMIILLVCDPGDRLLQCIAGMFSFVCISGANASRF